MQFEMYRDDDGVYTLPDGVYFGLDEEIYHADSALGSTSVKELAKKPCKWQYDRIRKRGPKDTSFMIWGSAWHCRVLEGLEAYQERFAEPPVPADYPAAFTTSDSIKKFLHLHGKKQTGVKADLIERAKEIEGCPRFFDDILADWYAAHPGHVSIDADIKQEIEDAIVNMERDPVLSSIMQAGSLIDGAAELSAFFTIEGVRCKLRFDYAIPAMKTRNKAIAVDLKSFTTFKGGNDEDAAIRKVYDECYDLQAAHYLDGRKRARDLIAMGKVFGDAPNKEFVDGFFNAKDIDWVWVMLRRDAGMVPVTLSVDSEDPMLVHAGDIVTDALATYRKYVSEFGPNGLWSPPPKLPLRINRSVLPNYNRGVAYEQPENR